MNVTTVVVKSARLSKNTFNTITKTTSITGNVSYRISSGVDGVTLTADQIEAIGEFYRETK